MPREKQAGSAKAGGWADKEDKGECHYRVPL